jgi:hypothetical protein
VRGDATPVGEEFARVFEYDHAVAEQAPPLFGVAGYDASRIMIDCVGTRTGGLVLALHRRSPVGGVTKVTVTKHARYSRGSLIYEHVTAL